MKRLGTILGLLIFTFSALAQEDTYFQQKVDYDIDVQLFPEEKMLRGNLKMNYHNQSDDVLTYMYIHLWPNAYKDHTTAYANENSYSKDISKHKIGYIDSVQYMSGKDTLTLLIDSTNIDIAKLVLARPLMPGDSLLLETTFKVKIPFVTSRFGHANDTYQMTQWFPKVAVFDKDGWHPMPYLDQGEYYSEFGDYEVNITLPKDYVVGSTGNLQTASEIKWIEARVKKSEEMMKQLNDKSGKYTEEIKNETIFDNHYDPTPAKDLKTITYKAENVIDFAWFADRTWLVRKQTFKLDRSGREVTAWSMYYPKSYHAWNKSVDYIVRATKFYSDYLGDYPFDHVTAVEGGLRAGGGMEYPMVTVIAKGTGKPVLVDRVITHEVGHNWFQGILASNERVFPYLDEGLNSFYEKRYMETYYGKDLNKIESKLVRNLLKMETFDYMEQAFYFQAQRMVDQSMNLSSEQFSSLNYGAVVYMKSAIVFNYIKEYLGDDEFDKIMQSYYAEWKHRHPAPSDLKAHFKKANKDVDFLFDDIIPSVKRVDYKLKNVASKQVNRKGKKYHEIKLKNRGQVVAPFYIAALNSDTIMDTVWYPGFRFDTTVLFPFDKNTEAYELDGNYVMPEIYRTDNYYELKGLWKHSDKLNFVPLVDVQVPRYKTVSYLPIVGSNVYNKFMLGTAFYNGFVYEKRFEYVAAPLYDFTTNTMTGSARIMFNVTTSEESPIRKMELGVGLNSYHYTLNNVGGEITPLRYYRLMPFFKFNFRKKDERLSQNEFVQVRMINVFKEVIDTDEKRMNSFGVLKLNYFKEDYRKKNSYKFNIDLEVGDSYGKGKIEWNRIFSYLDDGRGLSSRLFVGNFLWDIRDITGARDNFTDTEWMLGGGNGDNDYLFEDVYLNRNIQNTIQTSSMWNSHRYWRDGGFRVITSVGQTSDWAMALNLTGAMKFKYLSGFLDIGTTPEYLFSNRTSDEPVLWVGGLTVNLGPLKMNFPLAYSASIANDINNNFGAGTSLEEESAFSLIRRTMTFHLNLTEFAPLKFRRRLLTL